VGFAGQSVFHHERGNALNCAIAGCRSGGPGAPWGQSSIAGGQACAGGAALAEAWPFTWARAVGGPLKWMVSPSRVAWAAKRRAGRMGSGRGGGKGALYALWGSY
jgi:hypothetical protein